MRRPRRLNGASWTKPSDWRATHGLDHLELRLRVANGFGLKVKSSKVSMRLELPPDADCLWKSFSAKLRNQINRPMKEGMTVRIGGLEELAGFYEVFSVNMRDVGTPVYSRKFFEAALRTFPESTRICTVYHQHEAVASGFVVGFRGTLEIPWASSLRKANRLAPNMLLYWSAAEIRVRIGLPRLRLWPLVSRRGDLPLQGAVGRQAAAAALALLARARR